jgi:hypothetical protein
MTTTINMVPDVLDFTVETTDHRAIEVTFVDETDAPIDLTGAAAIVEGPAWLTPTIRSPGTLGIVDLGIVAPEREVVAYRLVMEEAGIRRIFLTGQATVT